MFFQFQSRVAELHAPFCFFSPDLQTEGESTEKGVLGVCLFSVVIFRAPHTPATSGRVGKLGAERMGIRAGKGETWFLCS
jgi:hypothetical protein